MASIHRALKGVADMYGLLKNYGRWSKCMNFYCHKTFCRDSVCYHEDRPIELLQPIKPKQEAATNFVSNYKRHQSLFGDSQMMNLEDLSFCQQAAMSTMPASAAAGASYTKLVQDYMTVLCVIRNYQTYGHLVARLDPLELMFKDWHTTITQLVGGPPDRVIRSHGLQTVDPNQMFRLPPQTYIGGEETELPLSEILRRLELVYCRHLGAEYMYMENSTEVAWLRQHLETPGALDLTVPEKGFALSRIIQATEFENFLTQKWRGERKFGLEGGEAFIPALKQIIDILAYDGYDTFVLSTAHRGRLNILVNVIGKPMDSIFAQFRGLEMAEEGSGDVKYHLGTFMRKHHRVTNSKINIHLVANPSHLELASPVAVGACKAQQFFRNDDAGKKVVLFLIHGDASFSGQGIVYETMHLAELPQYKVHGVVHIVINNQVGFTTDPKYSRASIYPTDVARVTSLPVFHANGNDVESCMAAAKLAARYKLAFNKSVVLDIVCYRKYGHNEADEPSFTQPIMYQKIAQQKPAADIYAQQLINDGYTDAATVNKFKADHLKLCDEAFEKAKKETQVKLTEWLHISWSGFFTGQDPYKKPITGVKEEILVHICDKISSPPPPQLKFVLHDGLAKRILPGRKKLAAKRLMDWAMGEACAFGTLLKEGTTVRLSGQDVERGTFSHRHHVYHHQTVDRVTYNPIQELFPDQAQYTVCNSSLSECGVLGYEHGYSLVNPRSLVIWEAQFGDFANGGQPQMDNIIATGESKWIRQSGMVILLPHGYEGMGGEHSSGRIERVLQLSDDDPEQVPKEGPEGAVRQLKETNWIVANCTTPGNFFHVLRRQIHLAFRKPLVVFTPKSLLRHPLAVSSFDEMAEGTQFRRVIPEAGPAAQQPDAVKKLIFCSGKVYYDIFTERQKRKLEGAIAISRVEQLHPFPYDSAKAEVKKYPKAKVFWCQEEHKNQGPWYYMQRWLNTVVEEKQKIGYNGRASQPTTATGNKVKHLQEVAKLMEDAMTF